MMLVIHIQLRFLSHCSKGGEERREEERRGKKRREEERRGEKRREERGDRREENKITTQGVN